MFFKRITVANTKGTLAIGCVINVSAAGVTADQYPWAAPNQTIRQNPGSSCEVLPELAQVCGLPPNCSRRVACIPNVPTPLDRAFSLHGLDQTHRLTVSMEWESAQDLDLSVLVYDNMQNLQKIIFYNNKIDYNGAIAAGEDRSKSVGLKDENIRIFLSMLPPTAHFLCLVITSFEGAQLNAVKSLRIKLLGGDRDIELARSEIRKLQPMPAMLYGFIFRTSPSDWSIISTNIFMNAASPVKAQPLVGGELAKLFNIY